MRCNKIQMQVSVSFVWIRANCIEWRLPNYSQDKADAMACLLIIRRWRFNLILRCKPSADSIPHAQPFSLTCCLSDLEAYVSSRWHDALWLSSPYSLLPETWCSQHAIVRHIKYINHSRYLRICLSSLGSVLSDIISCSVPSNCFHPTSSDLIWRVKTLEYMCASVRVQGRIMYQACECMCVLPVVLAFIVHVCCSLAFQWILCVSTVCVKQVDVFSHNEVLCVPYSKSFES